MRKILLALAMLALSAAPALAANCSSFPYTLTNGQTADAVQVMADFNNLLTCANNNLAHNGANSDITSLTGLTTPLASTYGGTVMFTGGTSTGAADAQVLASVTPSTYVLTSGNRVTFVAGFTNTTAATLNVNGTGATALRKRTGLGLQALSGSEIVVGQVYTVQYDGTYYELLDGPGLQDFGPQTSLASATTTDIGTVFSRNVLVTGTNAVTGFGSSAATSTPLFFIGFDSNGLKLTHNGTSLILPGAADIYTSAGDYLAALYLGSGNWRVLSYWPTGAQPGNQLPASYLQGLTLSKSGATTLGIAAGSARSSDNTQNISLASAYTKTTNVGWTVGTGNGCLDTGAIAANTWYATYVIKRIDTAVSDVLCTVATSTINLPANYTVSRRIGDYLTDASSNMLGFHQYGDEFWWDSPPLDMNNVTVGAAQQLQTLTVPQGISVLATVNVSSSGGTTAYLHDPALTDLAPSFTAAPLGVTQGNSYTSQSSVRTNTSGQVDVRSSAGATGIYLATVKWMDRRGRDD